MTGDTFLGLILFILIIVGVPILQTLKDHDKTQSGQNDERKKNILRTYARNAHTASKQPSPKHEKLTSKQHSPVYEQLLYVAEPLVKACVDKYLEGDTSHFIALLIGPLPPYTLESYPGAGHNHYVVLEAIYNYQKQHPEIDVESILKNTLIRLQKHVSTVHTVELLFKYIDAELKYENEKTSPFKIITEEFLEETKKQILDKKEEIVAKKEDLNFDVWQEYLFKGIEERHGIRIK